MRQLVLPREDSLCSYEPTREDRNWASLAHLSALLGLIVPLGNVLGPVLIWIFKRGQSPYVYHHASEAINFQVSMAILFVASVIALVVYVGIFLIPAVLIITFCSPLIAAKRAYRVDPYAYLFCIRFLGL